MKKYFWYIVCLVCIVCVVGISMIVSAMAQKANEGIVVSAHIKGAASPKAVLTEYSDFQCPACGQFYPVVKKLMDTYGAELQLEYKHFPLSTVHQHAIVAAKAAEAAGQQGQFWQMHDILFLHQRDWENATNVEDLFTTYAGQIGLNVDQYKKDFHAPDITTKIDADQKSGTAARIDSTPTFFINGEKISPNPVTYAEFQRLIEAAQQAGVN